MKMLALFKPLPLDGFSAVRDGNATLLCLMSCVYQVLLPKRWCSAVLLYCV